MKKIFKTLLIVTVFFIVLYIVYLVFNSFGIRLPETALISAATVLLGVGFITIIKGIIWILKKIFKQKNN